MKERQFDTGDTIASEGSTGIGFFIIDEGEATVSVHGEDVNTLAHGDHFGEVALIDDGARTATITAKTPLKCYGITSWEFRPLVESNAEARMEDAPRRWRSVYAAPSSARANTAPSSTRSSAARSGSPLSA